MSHSKTVALMTSLCLAGILNGCALSTKDARDPLENWNRDVHSFNDKVDHYAFKPIAQGYHFIMPNFVDNAVTNAFSNVADIGVFLNDFMQLKFKQGGEDTARFLVNSVAGVGGLIDVAEMIDLPKHNEDFDQTLGFWGVPTGPYVVLPFWGSSSPRGIGGRIGDAAMNPLVYIDNGIITGALAGLYYIDKRADLLPAEKIAKEAAIDQYDFLKNSYFQQRNFLVHDGKVPEDENMDIDNIDTDKTDPAKP